MVYITGQDVVIAKRGEPIARLVRVHPALASASARPAGESLAAWPRAHPLPAHLSRSHNEIETSIRRGREARD